VREAELLGGEPEEGFEQVLVILVQQRVAAAAGLIRQRRRVEGPGVKLDPVVDALPGHAEHAGDVRRRAPAVELQDRQGAAEEAGVRGLGELAAEVLPLLGSQVEAAHGLLLGWLRDS
jgi:hypothetical protein